MAELSSRYPNNPVKVAETIEKCVAPSGEECDRIAKIVTAIPTLAPQLSLPKPFDYAEVCRHSPPELRRCLLPSYSLGHTLECQTEMKKTLTQLEIKPKNPEHPEGDTYPDDCAGFVSIYITKDGTWLATGRDDKARCFAPRKPAAPSATGELDADWLELQLRKLKATDCPPSSAELASAPDVAYRDVIATMDVSIKAGVPDVGLSEPDKLSVPLATANPKGAPSDCPPAVLHLADNAPGDHSSPTRDHAMPPDNQGPPSTNTKDALASAPVLVITKDALSLSAGSTKTELGSIADASKGTGNFVALTKALPPTKNGLLILQADASTPIAVINRVVSTAKAAGYTNVMFAVKKK